MQLLSLILFSINNVHADGEADNVSVVEGIPVPSDGVNIDVADDRIDLGFEDDQIAEESHVSEVFAQAQDRDGGGGHHHHHADHAAPAPAAAPAGDSYDSPQAPPAPAPVASGQYGAPQAAPIDEYGAPQAPISTQYNPPAPQPQKPIPVPLPIGVKPGSIVIPGRPQRPRPPPPKKPQYKPPPPAPRPPPPKKPSYKPAPQKRPPPPPPPPKYKPRPPPVKQPYQPKPKPQKPAYRPPPPAKPQYKPPPKPQYKPQRPQYVPKPTAPQRPKYQKKPQPPKYRPPPPQPPKQTYTPNNVAVPNNPAPTYVQPSAPKPEDAAWPQPQQDMPKITSLDVQCEKNLMKVSIAFDKPFKGIIFSKGYYSDVNCVHLPAGVGKSNTQFDIAINSCGTAGNTENGLYGYGADSGSGTYFENTIVVQYDPQVQEVWDQARKLRCTWHDQYEKSVTFRPFPVDMLDVVRADFAGDNVGCWMQIQVGKGPWASEVSGLVKIGQTMTMVLAIKDDEQKFDMLVRNCMAHDGKRAPIQLVDQAGCVTRPKLMSKFNKIKNFGASASVLSYAHFQAFKFPDSMEVHFQCTIQICRYACPEQCPSAGGASYPAPAASAPQKAEEYGAPAAAPQATYNGKKRTKRAAAAYGVVRRDVSEEESDSMGDVGIEKVIHVVSSGDLTFDIKEGGNDTVVDIYPPVAQSLHEEQGYICMSTPAFAATLIILLAILIISCFLSAFLCLRHRSYYGDTSLIAAFINPVFAHKKGHF